MLDIVPEPDPVGFVEDVERRYSNDRYSDVYYRENYDIPFVYLVAGEHPAYFRFIKDTRKYLFRNGFVLWNAEKDGYNGMVDGEAQYRHKITGIPVVWILAFMNDMLCGRGACMRLIEDADSDFCAGCGDTRIKPTGFQTYG